MPTDDLNDKADPLDADDYDPIDHLNHIFSHPSTLPAVRQTYHVLETYQDDLDEEIEVLEEEQDRANADCLARMETSKAELSELLKQIEDVQQRALQTERNITEMTADIKRLDNTKKNLALSMTALKRLQMLTTAYEQLKALVKTRQYRECAQLLQAVIQLMTHFKSYRSIDQIAALSRNVADVQRELLEHVCEDFELAFAKEELPQKRPTLRDACMVVDALGEAARSRLVTWYCNTELRQYRTIFRSDQEAGSLDNIDRRYAFFKKTLKLYDEEHAAIFPPHWQVGSILAHVFAENTRDDYKTILGRSTRNGQTIDVKLLLSCLQQTLDFEQALDQRFGNNPRMSIDTTVSMNEDDSGKIIMSNAFEPYLGLWVDQQDRDLSRLMQEYKGRPTKPPDEEFNSEHVISSSIELIKFYQVSLVQCAKLSPGQPLLDLSRVFAKYFDQYAHVVLLPYVSEKASGHTPSRLPALEDIIAVLNTADYCHTTTNQLEGKVKSRIDPQFVDLVDLSTQSDTFLSIASTCVRRLVRTVEVPLEPLWREMRNTPFGKIETCENNSAFIPPMVQMIQEQSGRVIKCIHKPQYARAFADNLLDSVSSTYATNIPLCKPISTAGAEQMLLDTHELRKVFTTIIPGNPPPPLYLKRVNTTFSRIEPLLKTVQVGPTPAEALVQAYLVHIADTSDSNFRKVLDLKGIRGRNEIAQLIELFQLHKQSSRYAGALVDQNVLLTSLLAGTTLSSSATTSTTAGTSSPLPTAALSNLQTLGSSAAASLGSANLPGNLNLKFLPDSTGLPHIGSAILDRFSSSSSPAPVRSEGRLSPSQGSKPPVPTFAVMSARNSDDTGSNSNIASSIVNTNDQVTNATAANNESITPALIPEAQPGKMQENLKNLGNFFRRSGGGGGVGAVEGTTSGFTTPKFGFGRFGRGASPAPASASASAQPEEAKE